MPNQLFYPKSTTIYRLVSDSDSIYLPSPRNVIISDGVGGAATAGALLECNFDVSKGMVKEGDVVYNDKVGDAQRGEMCYIIKVSAPGNSVTMSANIGVVATTPFRIYRNAPDPCLIMPPGIIDKNDIWSLEDVNGNQFTCGAGSPSGLFGIFPLPVQVTRLLKTGSSINDPVFDYVICMHN